MRSHIALIFATLLAACSASTTGKTLPVEQERPHVQDDATPAASANSSGDEFLRASYHDCVAANDGSTWDMQDCIEAEFVYQDTKLNSMYRTLLLRLPEERKEAMKVEERSWIAEKEAACKWDVETEGQAQRIEANMCALERTAARAQYLEGVLRQLPGK